jgi:hypothetical protein
MKVNNYQLLKYSAPGSNKTAIFRTMYQAKQAAVAAIFLDIANGRMLLEYVTGEVS